jgi:predicted transcriptional regulator
MESQGGFRVDLPSDSQDLNVTLVGALEPRGIVFGESTGALEYPVESTKAQAPFQANATFSGIGSLYLHGKSIKLHVVDSSASLIPRPGGGCLVNQTTVPQRNQRDARYRDLCPEGGAAALLQPEDAMQVSIEAEGLDTVEWHHAKIACRQISCPDGGQRTDSTVGNSEFTVTNRILGFHRLISSGASVVGSGRVKHVMVGGPSFDLGVHGWVRLPLASGLSCEGCVTPKNQTLFARGDMVLKDLHSGPTQQLEAAIGGTVISARLDESSIAPASLFAVGLGAAAGIASVAILGGLLRLLFLYSRAAHGELSDKRREILDAIVSHAGVELSELSRLTGTARGTLRFHVSKLLSGEHIVERRQGRFRRFFENHGRYGDEWQAIALLREPEMRRLHEWILANAGVSTIQVARQANAMWKWSQSTTYHRIARLTEVKLIQRESGPKHGLHGLQLPVTRPSVSSGPQGNSQ